MKKIIAIMATVFLSFSLQAQSKDFLSDMLDTERVTFGQASYLCVMHLLPNSEAMTYEVSYEKAEKFNVLPRAKASTSFDKPITLATACFMLARIFNVKGGAMFQLTDGYPRYAFRQFQVDGIVPLSADSGLSVSGEEFLNLYTRCLRKYGE